MLIVSEDKTYGAFYAASSLHASASETNITLQPLGSISGVATDRLIGLPVKGASVSLIVHFNPKQGQKLEHSLTDERGQYRFEHLIPGMHYTLSIQAKKQDPAKPPQQTTVRLRPDTHLQLETQLD